jgi:hypothetical protein
MLMSMNMASTGPTEHTKDIDKAEDKALAYTEEIVQGIYTTKEDTKETKEIENSDRKSATFVTN